MKMASVTHKMKLVDEDGIIRDVEVTLKREADIRIVIDFPQYFDENGNMRKIIGQLVPQDVTHPRVDFSRIERRQAVNE